MWQCWSNSGTCTRVSTYMVNIILKLSVQCRSVVHLYNWRRRPLVWDTLHYQSSSHVQYSLRNAHCKNQAPSIPKTTHPSISHLQYWCQGSNVAANHSRVFFQSFDIRTTCKTFIPHQCLSHGVPVSSPDMFLTFSQKGIFPEFWYSYIEGFISPQCGGSVFI